MFNLNKTLCSVALLWASALPVSANTAPEFTLPEIYTNDAISSEALMGSVVYLDFWASWCGPCRVSLPAMDNLYKKYSDQGFEVVAVNLDDNLDEALSFLNKTQLSYLIAYDADKKLPDAYKVEAMPTSFLIDRNGQVRYVHKGFKQADLNKLESKIQSLLSE